MINAYLMKVTLNAGIKLNSNYVTKASVWRFRGRTLKALSVFIFLAFVQAGIAMEDILPEPVIEIEPTVVSTAVYNDPFENVNRWVFGFNDKVYRYALSPVSKAYINVIPAPVQRSVSGVFSNLREPFYALFHTFQGELKPAGKNLARFAVNTTVGILGIFDPADAWFQLEKNATSLNETMMVYELKPGPYLVIPLLGPSDLRNAGSRLTESFFHPVQYVTEDPETSILIIFDSFQANAPMLNAYPDVIQESDDPYIYLRNQYLQGVARDQELLDERD